VAGVVGLCVSACGGAGRQARLRIRIRPKTLLVDASPQINITGLRPGQSVQLTATTRRALYVWSGSATFRADSHGQVNLARQAPLDHAYDGTAALGLLGVQRAGASISPKPGPTITSFQAHAAGRSATATLRQLGVAGDVRTRLETVRKDGFYGQLYLPPGHTSRPAVVVWGGSEGGISTSGGWAGVLASHGIPALGIAYFDAPGLPCALSRIPLEYFVRAINFMRHQPGVDPHRVWLLSGSRGSEAEALIAAHFPKLIHGFVAAPPGSIGYGSVEGRCRPSSPVAWTLRGRAVPYAVPGSGLTKQGTLNSRVGFMQTLHTARTRRALIPIQGFRGPVLLLAGADDQLAPSPVSSAQMMRELRHDPAPHERRIYPGVGHLVLGIPSVPAAVTGEGGRSVGGTEAADDATHRTDWPLVIRFIRQN
jgi:hypothetical protein